MTKGRTHRPHPEFRNAAEFARNYGPGPIGRYYMDHHTPDCPQFARVRLVKYFRQDMREPPQPLAELIGPRLAPAPGYQVSSPLADARRDFVLPRDAPQTIASIGELIAAFDTIPPLERDVMAELKFILRSGTAPHYAYEMVRGFALGHFAAERRLAAILVLHLPGRAGSTAGNHIHLFVPARRLDAQGFGANAGNLLHDDSFAEIAATWDAWPHSHKDAS